MPLRGPVDGIAQIGTRSASALPGPEMIRSRVDLPEPERPSSPTISPWFQSEVDAVQHQQFAAARLGKGVAHVMHIEKSPAGPCLTTVIRAVRRSSRIRSMQQRRDRRKELTRRGGEAQRNSSFRQAAQIDVQNLNVNTTRRDTRIQLPARLCREYMSFQRGLEFPSAIVIGIDYVAHYPRSHCLESAHSSRQLVFAFGIPIERPPEHAIDDGHENAITAMPSTIRWKSPAVVASKI